MRLSIHDMTPTQFRVWLTFLILFGIDLRTVEM